MSTIRIKTNKYISQKVKLDSFDLEFNKLGIAEIEVEDQNTEEQLKKTVGDYSMFVHFLEDEENLKLEAAKEKNIDSLLKTISAKDKEISVLKETNEILATENTQLKIELKVYKQNSNFNQKEEVEVEKIKEKEVVVVEAEDKVLKKDKTKDTVETEEKKVEVVDQNKGSDFEQQEAYKQLSSKTNDELKDILKKLFSDFESEWKSLKTKEEFVLYIMKKSESLG